MCVFVGVTGPRAVVAMEMTVRVRRLLTGGQRDGDSQVIPADAPAPGRRSWRRCSNISPD